MDAITIATLARALERILDVAAGTLAIYCGFRLFSLLPATQTDSNGRFELPGVPRPTRSPRSECSPSRAPSEGEKRGLFPRAPPPLSMLSYTTSRASLHC